MPDVKVKNVPKLYEILAVENDLDSNAKAVSEEAIVTFQKKQDHFSKSHRIYIPKDDEEPDQPEEHHDLTTTVGEKLDYVLQSWNSFLDVTLQKEATNQKAVADLIINGVLLIQDVPATALLSLENKLKKIREVFVHIPTWQPGVDWKLDESISTDGRKIYKATHTDDKNRTVKTFEFKEMSPATPQHKAQIKEWESLAVVGVYKKTSWTGTISVAEKSRYLGNIDLLLREVKKARQRANDINIVKMDVSKILTDFIMQN